MTLLPKKKTILEIGCHEGLATSRLLENNPEAIVHAVDIRETKEYEENFDYNTKQRKKRLVKLKGKSVDTLRQMLTKFDYVYIDGAHDTKSVMNDIILTLPLLKKKAIIHFDDYMWNHNVSTPKPAIDWFLQYYADQITVLHRGYQVAVLFKS